MTMKTLLSALTVAGLAFATGCATTHSAAKDEPAEVTEAPAAPAAQPAPAEGAEAVAAPANMKAPGDAKIGDETTCPVSGETFTVTAESPKYDYKGKTFYTCCEHCMAKVQADPAQYLGKYVQQ